MPEERKLSDAQVAALFDLCEGPLVAQRDTRLLAASGAAYPSPTIYGLVKRGLAAHRRRKVTTAGQVLRPAEVTLTSAGADIAEGLLS